VVKQKNKNNNDELSTYFIPKYDLGKLVRRRCVTNDFFPTTGTPLDALVRYARSNNVAYFSGTNVCRV